MLGLSYRLGLEQPKRALLAREFAPRLEATDLVGLPNFNVYLMLMIDGEVSKAFSGTALARQCDLMEFTCASSPSLSKGSS